MNVLILGASGLIGSAVAQALVSQGHSVTGLARSVAAPRRRMPHANWREADMAKLLQPADWTPLLEGMDAVVNCAGALQDGQRDDVIAVQSSAMQALYKAAPPGALIVQISARTDGAGKALPFLASKRAADTALANAGLPYVILRPAVVVGRHAYGGTALLRALAAFPLISPVANADSTIQFAALDDVTDAVSDALAGRIAPGSDIEIAGSQSYTLAEAVARFRNWLGLPDARTVSIPAWAARIVAKTADCLGWLGWRSPLRSTALDIAAGGVTASKGSAQWRNLDNVLAANPAGVADLWFARLYLMKPLVFGVLSLFWVASGIIALVRLNASAAHLESVGLGAAMAAALTLATSLADIALGTLVLLRRYSALALKGMILVSLAYLAGATIVSPGLWLDPLGPLVKVLPSVVLVLVAIAILDER